MPIRSWELGEVKELKAKHCSMVDRIISSSPGMILKLVLILYRIRHSSEAGATSCQVCKKLLSTPRIWGKESRPTEAEKPIGKKET
jgi:hypothetical protein